MAYEVWDTETHNRVGSYRTEQAALRAVLTDLREYGETSPAIACLALLRRDPKGEPALIASSEGLVKRALALERPSARRKPKHALPNASS